MIIEKKKSAEALNMKRSKAHKQKPKRGYPVLIGRGLKKTTENKRDKKGTFLRRRERAGRPVKRKSREGKESDILHFYQLARSIGRGRSAGRRKKKRTVRSNVKKKYEREGGDHARRKRKRTGYASLFISLMEGKDPSARKRKPCRKEGSRRRGSEQLAM